MKQYTLQIKGTLGKRFITDAKGDGTPVLYPTVREAITALWHYVDQGCSYTWRVASYQNGKNKPLDRDQLITSIGEVAFQKLSPLLEL